MHKYFNLAKNVKLSFVVIFNTITIDMKNFQHCTENSIILGL